MAITPSMTMLAESGLTSRVPNLPNKQMVQNMIRKIKIFTG